MHYCWLQANLMAMAAPPVESRQTSNSAEAFLTANARKLGALALLLLIGCLGLGTRMWLGSEEMNVDLARVISGHQVSTTNLSTLM